MQEPSHVLSAGKDAGLKAWLWAFAGKARTAFPIFWLNLPNLVALVVVPWLSGLRALGMVLLVAAWWGWPILVSRSARALWLLNLPFAMLAWPAAVYIAKFKDVPFDGFWFSLWQTNLREVMELARFFSVHLLVGALGVAAYLACALGGGRPSASLPPTLRQAWFLGSLVIAIVLVSVPQYAWKRASLVGVVDDAAVEAAYPLGMVQRLVRTRLALAQRGPSIASPLPRLIDRGSEREVYVLVVGETARYDAWMEALRARNSSLLTDSKVKIMSGNTAQATTTFYAVHMMLTGAESFRAVAGRPTWVALAKGMGFGTGWISNNGDLVDDRRYVSGSGADFFNGRDEGASFVGGVRYDEELLPIVERALRQGPSKLCLVVHLYGSHFDYRKRYPPRFGLLPVDTHDYEHGTGSRLRTALLHAYSNSMAENVYVLEELIGQLEKLDARALLLYTADHGENLLDDARQLMFHGQANPTAEELHVPMLVWASDRFVRESQAKWDALGARSAATLSNGQVLPTLLDAMDAQLPSGLMPSLMSIYPGPIDPKVQRGDGSVVSSRTIP